MRAGTRSRIMSSNFDEEIIAPVARAVSIRRTDLRRFFATELFVANIFADPMQSDARLFHLFFFLQNVNTYDVKLRLRSQRCINSPILIDIYRRDLLLFHNLSKFI